MGAVNPLPSNPLESFTYDEVGNRVDSNQNGLSTFNVANQLNENAEFTYAYDSNGNQIQKTDKATLLSTQFEYDAENRLIRVVREDSSIVNYRYDGLGRRVEKDVAGVVTQYIYDNEDILLELDGTETIVARYTHGPGVDEPLIMERDLDLNGSFDSIEGFFYQVDGLGSVTEITDSSGTVARSYTYDSFGQIVDGVGVLENPYTYAGREFDPESDLYYYRARYYDATVGRFLTEDPISFGGGSNFYLYTLNNPINFTDPSGLCAAPDQEDCAEQLVNELLDRELFSDPEILSRNDIQELKIGVGQHQTIFQRLFGGSHDKATFEITFNKNIVPAVVFPQIKTLHQTGEKEFRGNLGPLALELGFKNGVSGDVDSSRTVDLVGVVSHIFQDVLRGTREPCVLLDVLRGK